MKKLLTILAIMLCVNMYAQDGYNYLILKGGVTHEKGYNVSMAFDFNTNSYNTIELGLNYYSSKEEEEKNYESYLLSLNYKMNLVKSLNSNLLLKLGAMAGTDNHNFLVGPNLGLEYQYALSRGIQVILSNNNYYLFDSPYNNWKIDLALGLKIAL